jgi:iron(III) transport system ATP-binding protein
MTDGGARVRLDAITKRFGSTLAVDAVSLTVEPGEFLTLLGPSGCGKTTTLRIVAGLEEPTGGRVWIDDEDVTDRPPHARDITMVFQSYALFPHLSVFENVAYGLRVLRRPADEVRHRVGEALGLAGIGDLGSRPPSALSGGQQQRVALARALVLQPKVLLFDEPLSNLDAKLRKRMRDEIRALQRRTGITALYVTHDQAEALAISDRIAVMARGRVEQLGAPAEIYRRPATRFVADFIGEANLLPVAVEESGPGGTRVRLGALTLRVPGGATPAPAATLVARPEAIRIRTAAAAPPPDGALAGEVRQAAYLGAAAEYAIATEVGIVAVTDALMPEGLLPAGSRVWLTFAPERLVLLSAHPDGGET